MKRKIYTVVGIFLFASCIFNMQSQEISLEKAKDIASKWHQYVKKKSLKELNSVKVKSVVQKREKEDEVSAFYGVNFEDGGYVIVSSEESVGPILAYSKISSFKEGKMDEGEQRWWDCVESHIKQQKEKNGKEKKDMLKSASSFDASNFIMSLSGSTSVVNVPSLFETYQTSRWAGWDAYKSEFPGGVGDNACFPIAMAQVIKYYRFPIQGKGSHNGMDFSRQRYNYDMMPFRLTYCGNSTLGGICDDGTFEVIPGVTEAHIQEVSRLIYHCAVAVDWTSTGGTSGSNWAINGMVNSFNYSSEMTTIGITNNINSEAFKSSLRNELINRRPIFFSYTSPVVNMGHTVVIDGVENDNYFHFAMGRGGSEDVYYYLFDADNDGIHNPTPHFYPNLYVAVIGIVPNCPQSGTINLNNLVISSSESNSYLSDENINMNNFIIQNGGQVTMKAANEVNFGNEFEAEIGSDILITTGTCGPPD